MAEYSKLGYGNAEDVEAAIALGMIDGKDIIITKDTSELLYVRDDLSVQTIRPRQLVFDSVSAANEKINSSEDSYEDEKGKYSPWIVQREAGENGQLMVEPFSVAPTNFRWTEF